MTRKHLVTIAAAICVISSSLLSSQAQPGTATKPVKKPGLLQRMGIGKKDSSKATISTGKIIGNKNSKVYHMPGDKGNMPADKNTIYFKTESAAIAAGYHKAGGNAKSKVADKTTSQPRDPKTGRFMKK